MSGCISQSGFAAGCLQLVAAWNSCLRCSGIWTELTHLTGMVRFEDLGMLRPLVTHYSSSCAPHPQPIL